MIKPVFKPSRSYTRAECTSAWISKEHSKVLSKLACKQGTTKQQILHEMIEFAIEHMEMDDAPTNA